MVDDDVDVDRLAAAAEIADLRRIMAAVADKLRAIIGVEIALPHQDLRHVHAGAGRTVRVRFGIEQRTVLRAEHLHKAQRRIVMQRQRRFHGEAALCIEHHIRRCLHTGGHIDRDVLAAEAGRTGQVDVQRLRLIFRCNCIGIRPEIGRVGHIPRDGRFVDLEMVPRSGRQFVDDQLFTRIHDIPSFRNVGQPMLPFISRRMRLFISTAYSSGSSLETLSAKPLTISARASSSLMPRLMR